MENSQLSLSLITSYKLSFQKMWVEDPQRTPPKTKPPLIPFFLQTLVFYVLLFSLGLAVGAIFFPFNLVPSPPPPRFTSTTDPDPINTVHSITDAVHSITDDDELRKASMAGPMGLDDTKTKDKIAFMFLTRGPLALAPLWEMFFHGYEGLYTIYIHPPPSYNESFPPDSVFFRRRIPSKEVKWGKLSMLEAEQRLLSSALMDDASNRHFVLLSDSCIPLFNFTTVYSYLTGSSTVFVESLDVPGPNGQGRYEPGLLPTVSLAQWRKGSQWFHLDRPLASSVISDSTFFPAFRRFSPDFSDEHYLPTLLGIRFGSSTANRSVTWVDWSTVKNGAHPASFQRQHVTPEFLGRLRGGYRCEYNGESTSVCYLFARKFMPSCLSRLMIFAPKVLHFGQRDREMINRFRNRNRTRNMRLN